MKAKLVNEKLFEDSAGILKFNKDITLTDIKGNKISIKSGDKWRHQSNNGQNNLLVKNGIIISLDNPINYNIESPGIYDVQI
jgi:hypothetical protein